MSLESSDTDIAIVGMAAHFPGAPSVDARIDALEARLNG